MDTRQPLKVLIIGAGTGGTALIDLFNRGTGVQIIGVADRDAKAPGLKLAAQLHIPTTTDVTELVTRDGAHVIIDVTGDPDMAADIAPCLPAGVEILGGTAARLLWTLVQKEQELQAQLMQAERLATLGTFSAQIAHDLKSPLYCIREFARFIEEAQDPASIQEYSREILKADKYLTSIVETLMSYARAEGREVEMVRLTEVLDQAVVMARFATAETDVEVVRDYGDVPPIPGNRSEWLQICVNLITNAVQAMNGHGQLTLVTRMDGEDATMTIEDTGVGIAAAHREKIFAPFFTTKGRGVGTGLGLAIVETLVGKYDGRVEFESEEGHGATFRVRVPVQVKREQ